MAKDITKAGVWSDADVFVSFDLAATLPADASTPFSAVSWVQLGLLDGDEGFETDGSFDSKKEHYGWGGILIATTRSKWKEIKKFTALEENATTRRLRHPGSAPGEISIPTIENVKVAFETRNGGKVHRVICKNYAQVEIDGGVKESEEDLTKLSFMATIYPDSNKVLWSEQAVPTVASIALVPLTLALTVGQIKTVVATATYTDATTGDVSATAQWSSSNPAKATVFSGYVTGVQAGTTNITASLGGVTSTAPSVATVT